MQTKLQSPPSAVAAEVVAGDVQTLPQIARRCASTRQSKLVHPSTVLRWTLDGVKTPDGRPIRSEGVRRRKSLNTSRMWMESYHRSRPDSIARLTRSSEFISFGGNAC